jgi:hypothetical protein
MAINKVLPDIKSKDDDEPFLIDSYNSDGTFEGN